MNLVVASGRLLREPEMKRTRNNKLYFCCRFMIEGDFRGAGRDREQDPIMLIAFNKRGQDMYQRLHKGIKILVRGKLRTYETEEEDGRKRERHCIIVQQSEVIDPRRERDVFGDLRDGDGKKLIPPEVTENIHKIVDKTDEDMPDDFIERTADDIFQG